MPEKQKYGKDRSPKVLEFLRAYAELCGMHKLCLSHEDSHGGFLVHPLNEADIDWVFDAAEDPNGH